LRKAKGAQTATLLGSVPMGIFFWKNTICADRGFGNKGLIEELVKSGQGQWVKRWAVQMQKHGNRVMAFACVLLYAVIVAIRQVQVTMAVRKRPSSWIWLKGMMFEQG
jgi:hypothetical protein